MLSDFYREILDTITRNKSRSFLTGFGVFWGVFMLIVLIGGGQGLKEMLQSNFAGFATNTAMIWTQNTTKPYKGFRKGRYVSMVENDMTRLRQQVPDLLRLLWYKMVQKTALMLLSHSKLLFV